MYPKENQLFNYLKNEQQYQSSEKMYFKDSLKWAEVIEQAKAMHKEEKRKCNYLTI
jgi:hypothetical protein